MTRGEERPLPPADAAGEPEPSSGDLRMASLLSANPRGTTDLKRELQEEATDESDDILARLNALEYVDTLVGEIGSDLPQRLGDYRIVGLLGRGGMGTVFEAFQESLERSVALKVLAPSLTSDPRMRKRFRTEARACATLHHQHIVPVYGFGEAGGFLYFAMERVDGVSLDRHIAAARHRDAPPMGPREAARRFAGVADALGHAHRRGILHRDVKPGNVLVHPDGSLALADFGLSKVAGEQSMSVSQHGGFLGTLQYAAPEQARGRPATPSSDLYSLGVTIYECVTGRLPLQGESAEAILHALLDESPPALRQILPKAPRDLEIVLEKLLAKDPEDRYADGEALSRDLQRIADDEPVHVRRRSIVVRAWRQVRKHRLLSAVIAIASGLLLAVFVVWQLFLGEERAARLNLHEVRLAQAVARAEAELGPLDGPDGLLESLLGADLPSGQSPSEVPSLLADAAAERPDDERAVRLREAYLTDPVADATAALRLGRGRTALAMLDAEIAAAESSSGFVARDSVTWLRLYRLYLARAVANLTAAVADPEAAGRDLLRASFVRQGAFAPALLSALVTWRPAAGAAPLLTELDQLMEKVPAELDESVRSVVAALLFTLAGAGRPHDANLLPVDLRYEVRRDLVARAGELAVPRATERTRRAGRLEELLADAARRATAAIADVPVLRAALARGGELLDSEIAAGSPLQCWRVVYALLELAEPSGVVLPDGRPLEPRIQVRGIEEFLALEVSPDLLRRLREPLDRALTFAEAAGVPVHRARALLACAAGDATPQAALEAAHEWVAAAPGDPAAYICRLRCRIANGDVAWASQDGVRAFQLALDQDEVRDQLTRILEQAALDDPARAERWRELRASFGRSG